VQLQWSAAELSRTMRITVAIGERSASGSKYMVNGRNGCGRRRRGHENSRLNRGTTQHPASMPRRLERNAIFLRAPIWAEPDFPVRRTSSTVENHGQVQRAGGDKKIRQPAALQHRDKYLAEAASTRRPKVIFRGLKVRPIDDLIKIAAAWKGCVVFAD